MIILVAVTVSVALQGGLFDKAKDAARLTEPQAIREKIIAAMDLNTEGNNPDVTMANAIVMLNEDLKDEKNPTYEHARVFSQGGGTPWYQLSTNEISRLEGTGDLIVAPASEMGEEFGEGTVTFSENLGNDDFDVVYYNFDSENLKGVYVIIRRRTCIFFK